MHTTKIHLDDLSNQVKKEVIHVKKEAMTNNPFDQAFQNEQLEQQEV